MDIGTQDFSGIVERIKAEKPDYTIVLLTGEAGYNYTQQAADAGIGPQDMMFHANQAGLESKSWWENVQNHRSLRLLRGESDDDHKSP